MMRMRNLLMKNKLMQNDFGCKNSTNENKSSGEIIQIQARCFNATLIGK